MDQKKAQKLQACAGWNVRKLSRMLSQIYDEAYRPTGLKNTQFSMLAVLSGKGSMTINALAEFMGADRTTITRNVSIMKKQMLVEVHSAKSDSRAKEVQITERGTILFESAYPHWEHTQRQMIDVLGEQDWAVFLNLLQKMQYASHKMIE